MQDVVDLSYWGDRPVRVIRLNRPSTLNAMNEELVEAFDRTLTTVEQEEDTRLVVVTGEPPAFSSGADIGDLFREQSASEARAMMRFVQNRTTRRLRELDVPVVAMVNGPAVGGGMSLALSCDLVVASKEAYFQAVFSRLGLVADLGLVYHLVRGAGYFRAMDLLLTGREIEPAEALEFGLVNRVAEPGELETVTEELVDQLLTCSPLSHRHSKDLARDALTAGLSDFLHREAVEQGMLLATEDLQEAKEAFFEDRTPSFQGR